MSFSSIFAVFIKICKYSLPYTSHSILSVSAIKSELRRVFFFFFFFFLQIEILDVR